MRSNTLTTDRHRLPLAVRHPWPILVVALLGTVLAGLFGGDVQDSLASGGFDDPASESSRAVAIVDEEFGQSTPDLVLLVTADGANVDAPDVVAAGAQLVEELEGREDVAATASYWSLGNAPPLRSVDGDKALVLVQLGGDENARLVAAAEIRETFVRATYPGTGGPVSVGVGGQAATFAEVNEVVESDLVAAEIIAFPITALLLLWVFGSAAAAGLPLVIGGFAIIGTFLALKVVGSVTEVSIFALNFTTAMGLGLAIDYSLLVVNRFREEMAAGHDPATAGTRTVRSAGRTVVFSGLTVASSLAALLVFQFSFLRSFAWAGFAVVGLAVVGAVVVLPAILVLLGERVNALRVRRLVIAAPGQETSGAWHRIALTVMRRPVPIATVSILLLLILGIPFLRVELGFPDDRVLPPDAESRQVADVLREEFISREQSAMPLVLADVDISPGTAGMAEGSDVDSVADYAARVSAVEGVARVDSGVGSFVAGSALPITLPTASAMVIEGATFLSVVPDIEPVSAEGEALVAQIRSLEAPGTALLGGASADLVDSTDGLLARLPLALGLIALVTFVVLFLAFGSVLMPIKAIVLNLLSLTATLGAMVWIFQDGRFEDLIGFTATGTLTVTMPVLMFVIAFGLSMDYEVFLLSRIKEEWDATHDPIGSVALGLERTGRIVTAAAVLIAVVFLSFGLTGSVSFMAMFGLGLTLAILVDAFVVRTTLVPAFMRLAGSANWWAPAPLRRLHERYGFNERVDPDEGVVGISRQSGWLPPVESGLAEDSDALDRDETAHEAGMR